jgi:NAD(P)-dependent dehydrogenase (short-subunit alcohol dehydrogenase family)
MAPLRDELSLAGRVAVVTGGSRGIGRAIAEALAEGGAAVGIAYREREGPAREVEAAIHAAGGRAWAGRCDVADEASVATFFDAAAAALGPVDILVNNAGITRDRMSFNMTEDEWDEVVRANLKGHFAPSRFAGAHWRGHGTAPGRRIVNTTSEGGLFPARGHANYSASKAGIVGITLELASELGKYGVTVNAVAMRARTRMTEGTGMFAAPASGPDRYDPTHTAKAVAWLSSDSAADVTGQVLLVVGSRVSVVGPLALSARADLADEWSSADLAAAKSTLFPGGGTNVVPAPPA